MDADFTLGEDEDNFKGNCHALKCINITYSPMYWTCSVLYCITGICIREVLIFEVFL